MINWILNYNKKQVVKTQGKYAVRRWKMLSGWEYLDKKSGYWWSDDIMIVREYCLVDTVVEAKELGKEMSIKIVENV